MLDEKDFSEIVERGKQLQADYIQRNKLLEEMEEMFFLNWSEEAKVRRTIENVKVTLSPDPRNQIKGAVSLLIASDPVFSIPGGLNDPDVMADSEPLEKFAQTMWRAAGKIAGCPIHYNAALSALLYGETHVAISSTEDILEAAGKKGDAYKARAERTARRTPFLFDVWNPKDCFPEFDNQGLTAHFRRTKTTKQRVGSEFGEDADHITGKGSDEIILCEFWDLENHVVWVEGVSKPILSDPHGLPFIPIEVAITDGSLSLFNKPDEQRQPFLYAIAKSGLWHRQNLSLTVMYTMLHGIGANPMFIYKAKEPDKELNVKWDVPGGQAVIEIGEELIPMAKILVDPNLWQSLEVADKLSAESTIYKQTLGEPLGKNAPYSMVALLSQSGRLPLVSPQRRLGWLIASVIEKAFLWMKEDNRKGSARYEGDVFELEAGDIPDDFEIEATLDVNLPQDDVQAANVARQLTEGDDPLVSNEWVLKKILKVEQPDEMKYQIWREEAANLKARQYFVHQLLLLQEKMRMAMQPPMPPEAQGMPPGGMPPGGEQMPGVEEPPAGEPGELRGMPPVMAEGGGGPPQRPPNIPPPQGGSV